MAQTGRGRQTRKRAAAEQPCEIRYEDRKGGRSRKTVAKKTASSRRKMERVLH